MYLVCLFFHEPVLRIPLVRGASCYNRTVHTNGDETVGVALDCRNRLSVISVCGRRWSHNEGGKSLAVTANTLKKWALKFGMAASAAFLWWQPGGTSSIAILYSSLRIVFIASDTFLSRMFFFGTIPTCCRCVINT